MLVVTPYVADPDFTLYLGDAWAVMRDLPDESVDCCVTSPPYLDARPEYPSPSPHEFERIFRELGRVLSPEGSILLNVGRLFRDGQEVLWWRELLDRADWAGWSVIDTIIWEKPNAFGRGGPYLTNAHEYVFWLGTPDSYRNYPETSTPYAPETIARYARGYQNAAKGHPRVIRPRTPNANGARPRSVVSVLIGREKGNPHPAPMALELAEHLVMLACPPLGSVIDPFVGSGTTCLAARKHGRQSIGIDVSEAYCAMAARRLSQLSLLTEGTA